MKYWPYEETQFSLKDPIQGLFGVFTPWLRSEIEVEPGSANFKALLAHIENPGVSSLLGEILAALKQLPIAYQLPRHVVYGSDQHHLSQNLDLQSPSLAAAALGLGAPPDFFESEWTWDAEGALKLSQTNETFDPLSLLTIVRRFHYLDCADNKIAEVYQHVSKISEPEQQKACLASIVRQNHYVTELCEKSLAPALSLAGSAASDLREFMNAERGHDVLLERSLLALGANPHLVAPVPAVGVLMAALGAAAKTNFAAFCFSLDFFEKPQFSDEDRLAEVLRTASYVQAARHLQIHKKINDQGGHDCMAEQLLSYSQPLTGDYALQAIRLAELVSFAIAQVPYELATQVFDSSTAVKTF